METPEELKAAGISLPFNLPNRAKARETITAAIGANNLSAQHDVFPGAYRTKGANGVIRPCAIGVLIPDALAEWIDRGAAHCTYSVVALIDLGVFACDPRDVSWYSGIQGAHDTRRLHLLNERLARDD